ncbi:MAG: AAA family ATPase [Deltaproteobacteria bacterium]|jgi:ABC-type lipoprotein export system ATPase subunit|nr:AAA family ATPase [Deltaproteobacteria bacterium]
MPNLIDKITGFKIKTNFSVFKKETELDFFSLKGGDSKKIRVALLYGNNGSGKSTIAEGVRTLNDPANQNGIQFKLVPQIEEMPKVFVFDEKYIEQNIKVKSEGLKAIVLFGKQIEIENAIKNTKTNIENKEKERDQLSVKISEYKDKKNKISPVFWLNSLIRKLKEDGGWADIKGKTIKRASQKDSVTEDEVNRIGKLTPTNTTNTPTDTTNKFESSFQEKLIILKKTNDVYDEIRKHENQISLNSDIVKRTADLLHTIVRKPQLTADEDMLTNAVTTEEIIEVKEFLSDKSICVCPKCLQYINDDYRKMIITQIEKILNEDVSKFIEQINQFLVKEVSQESYEKYNQLGSYTELISNINSLNNAIKKHNSAIKNKINNIYENITYDESINLIAAYDTFQKTLSDIENEREKFNDAISQRKQLKDDLLILNDERAHFAIKDDYEIYLSAKKNSDEAEEQLTLVNDKIKKYQSDLSDLESPQKNYKIGVNEINKSLEYIFCSKDRLKLELGSDHLYHLKSKGINVDPSKVSLGERNAIALCYFFTEINTNKNANSLYSDEMLLLIDDPISSFDFDNKIGIFTYLNYKFDQILTSCASTKILIMTHDYNSMIYLNKIFNYISNHCKNNKKPADYSIFKLVNSNLEIMKNIDQYNEYSELLNTIFKFASEKVSENELSIGNTIELTIGNTMRRTIEAFTSFIYKKKFYEIIFVTDLLSANEDRNKTEFLLNPMYRLVLNSESHGENKVKTMQGIEDFNHISTMEKQRLAKHILCLIYHLNKEHIKAYLPENHEEIKKWYEEIG